MCIVGTTVAKELDITDEAVIDTSQTVIEFQSDALVKNQLVFKAQAVSSSDFQIITTAQPTSQLKVDICHQQDTLGHLLCNSVISNAEFLPHPKGSTLPPLLVLRIPNRHLLSKDLIVVDLPHEVNRGFFKAEFQPQYDQSLVLNHTVFGKFPMVPALHINATLFLIGYTESFRIVISTRYIRVPQAGSRHGSVSKHPQCTIPVQAIHLHIYAVGLQQRYGTHCKNEQQPSV